MDGWEPRLKLLSVLATTKEFLLRSVNEGWPDNSPAEAARAIDRFISHVLQPKLVPLPEFASVLYVPTGPVQEIAMANGWHGEYLELSEEYDALAGSPAI